MRQDWRLVTLNEVCSFENGDRGKNYPSRSEYVNDGFPFVNAGHLTENGVGLDGMNYITEENYNLLSRGKFQEGDILFCLRGTLGKFAKVQMNFYGAIASSLVIVRPSDSLSNDYLVYYFNSGICQKMIKNYAGGTAQPNLGAKDLKKFEIPIPPLPEQKRIVAILDEAFEAIDHAKANVEKNIQNAEELFQSKLNEIFSQSGEGWEEKTLGSVSGFQNGFAFKSKTYKEAGTPIIRIRDIQDGVIELSHIVYIDRNDYGKDLSKYEISKGDLLIAMSGATTGKIGIVEIDDTFLLNQRVGKFEPGKKLDKGYLYYYLSTKVEEALKISAGSAQPNLSTNQIKDFLIPLPPIRQQEIIVNELNNLSDKIDFFKEAYSNKMNGLEELKKSILQKAFSGELTAKEQVAV